MFCTFAYCFFATFASFKARDQNITFCPNWAISIVWDQNATSVATDIGRRQSG
jgi:hypothetical protein